MLGCIEGSRCTLDHCIGFEKCWNTMKCGSQGGVPYIYIHIQYTVYIYRDFASAQGFSARGYQDSSRHSVASASTSGLERNIQTKKVALERALLMQHPNMACNQCGRQWQPRAPLDLRRRRVGWAPWNFASKGEQWPKKTYKEALVSPPPALHGGKPPKKGKAKVQGIEKKLQEHWTTIPETLRSQLEAMGVKAAEPAPPSDLPTLIKEHLPSLKRSLSLQKVNHPSTRS